jgi:AAA family ATPase
MGSAVIVVNGPELTSAYHGETEASIRRVFTEARSRAPCIIILDEVDAICPKREEGAGSEPEKRAVATLLTELDGVGDGDENAAGRVIVVATTNRPNAIDPALRRPGRFDREIEIGTQSINEYKSRLMSIFLLGIPDANARLSIMKVLLARTPHTLTQKDLHALALRAHGYVGADLSAVVREAGTLAIKRHLSGAATSPDPVLIKDDLVAALSTVRPSTLRAHAINAKPVRFSDIGGVSNTIERLRESVEWPLIHANSLSRLGVQAPRGVLLCGPPGCSKTLLAQAIATEIGVNFLVVRGPEVRDHCKL